MPFGDIPICGIGGILRITPPGEAHEPIPDAWLDAIDDAIAWRGPDGAGRFRDKVVKEDGTTVEVALVHRRLSIIDHAGGVQPMVSEHGRTRDDGTREGLVALVFNGCIYNHRELREELEKRGHVFETDHSDTEVLVHLHRELQIEGRDPLDNPPEGMFAYAVWSRDDASVSLVRSWTHEKPLYTFKAGSKKRGGITAFASEPSSLRSLQSESDSHVVLSRDNTRTWLRFGFSDSVLPDESIHPVERGVMELSDHALGNESRVKEYIGITAAAALIASLTYDYRITLAVLALLVFALTVKSLIIRIRRPSIDASRIEPVIRRAISTRLEADVPLGCLLSGGVDSSLVAHYAMRELGALTTVSIRMDDERYDESRHAEMVAEHLGTDHHTIDIHPEPAEDLVHLINLMGLPFGDSSLLPTYWACKAAREHAKVVLTGDGADEHFFGYDRYRAMIGTRWLRALGMFLPLKLFRDTDPKSMREKFARLIVAGRHDGYTELLSIFPTPDFARLTIPVLGSMRAKGKQGIDHTTEPPTWGATPARNWDLMNYLPGDLLRKTDIASMAAGVELRAPFLDSDLSRLVWNMPRKKLMPRNERKALLKSIARKHLPSEIIDRPKMGFAIPVGEWFRTDYGSMRTLMMDTLTRPRPFGPCHDVIDFNLDYVRTMIREHDDRTRDHSQRLYMLTVLGVWADTLKYREQSRADRCPDRSLSPGGGKGGWRAFRRQPGEGVRCVSVRPHVRTTASRPPHPIVLAHTDRPLPPPGLITISCDYARDQKARKRAGHVCHPCDHPIHSLPFAVVIPQSASGAPPSSSPGP